MALQQLTQTRSTPQLNYDYDIAIVGGGIVGLTLACALKDSGLKIVLVEATPQSVAAAKGQAYNISLLSERILRGVGVWDKILPQVTTYRHIRLSDADHPGIVQFYPSDLGTDALGYVAEHHVLLDSLRELLQTCSNVSYLCPAEVVKAEYLADTVELEISTTAEIPSSKIRTRLLIGADGAKSRIRESAGIRTHGWQYWQSCVVATIKTEKSHDNTAFERFWPSGPTGILPLPGGHRCRIVWTAPHAEAEALRVLDEKEFLKKLEHRMGGLLGKLELDGSRFLFKVQLMQSDRYTLPRLALIGDAAHGCHPVGGQGMNMGIRDAGALAEIIQTAHQKGEDIGNIRVLKRYESWRKRENVVILGFTDFLDRIFSNNWLPVVAVRRFGLWIMRKVPPIKIFALQLMTGLRGRSPELAAR